MSVRLTPDTPVKYIKGIGEMRAEAFSRLGVFTVADLLTFYPRTYEERGRIVSIANAVDFELCSVEVTVCETSTPKYIKGNLNVFRSAVSDGTGTMELVFFNMPFRARELARGRRFRAYGRIKSTSRGKKMVSPKIELITAGAPLPYYVPVYRLSPPLTQKAVRNAIKEILPLCGETQELFPDELIKKYGLLPRSEAIRTMHNPSDEKSLCAARRTLAFAEITVMRLAASRMRVSSEKENASTLSLKNSGIKQFFSALPFELTDCQKRAVKEIFADMARPRPMARLLQGDVGSGKTVLAAAAIYLCVKNGFQACLMAPTEILAQQHKKTLDKFLSPFGIKTELIISGMPSSEKRRIRAGLADGSIPVAVGTHALITDDTEFENLALAVVDEQHRFGVRQRASLLEKSDKNGKRAHMLVMSATPIPRSLSLIIFGDLDVSVLDGLPAGRQPVKTCVASEKDREKIYSFIRSEAEKGSRAYIVCPLIDCGDEPTDKKTAEDCFADLSSGALSEIPMGLLHGRMKQSEKASVMTDFASGKIKILVSTTVIEVGVDVPEATVMLIENAESFGLSQLHQLRGRVGRGKERSVCILLNGSASPDSAERLRIMRDTSDGFEIASADLERRGPGEFFGERQSGEFSFASASLSDVRVISETDFVLADIKKNITSAEYLPIIRAADKLLERTGGGLTVN